LNIKIIVCKIIFQYVCKKLNTLFTVDQSAEHYQRAQQVLVGGVNSPVRAFKSVGGNPLFISHGKGSKIYDVDGNEYIDYVGSYGPLIVGHANQAVVQQLQKAIEKGSTFGATTQNEIELAQLVVKAFPHIEKIRFVNSGTEAILSTLRLVRAFTNKNKIIKFRGCYHGHCDALLVDGGSGIMTLGMSGSAGVPENLVNNTISVSFNDKEGVQNAFTQYGEDIAAVAIEPVAGNMGVILPEDDFLLFLREITQKHKALLVIDEVMTGFRHGFYGAQQVFNVQPDVTCLGKVIGGGLPVGAYGGRKEIMDMVAPLGPVYQAGTLSGNPLAMQAGISTLQLIQKPEAYTKLHEITTQLKTGLEQLSIQFNIPMQVHQFGSMISVFFTESRVYNYETAKTTNTELFGKLFWKLLEHGVYLPPSNFESWFLSTAHTSEDIEKTIGAFEQAFKEIN